MKQEDIIRMAREAGGAVVSPNLVDEALSKIMHVGTVDAMKWLAEHVRADERNRAMRENAYVLAEREECAKLLEESSGTGKLVSCMSAAAAIRARGQA